MKKLLAYFTKGELLLWGLSTGLILLFFLLFDRENYLTFRRSPSTPWPTPQTIRC